jgi:hypothetical protein
MPHLSLALAPSHLFQALVLLLVKYPSIGDTVVYLIALNSSHFTENLLTVPVFICPVCMSFFRGVVELCSESLQRFGIHRTATTFRVNEMRIYCDVICVLEVVYLTTLSVSIMSIEELERVWNEVVVT